MIIYEYMIFSVFAFHPPGRAPVRRRSGPPNEFFAPEAVLVPRAFPNNPRRFLRAIAALFFALTAAVTTSAFFPCASAANEMLMFRDDEKFLDRRFDLDATHYEVNRVIELNDTAENRIIVPTAMALDRRNQRLLVGGQLFGRIYAYSLKTYRYDGTFGAELYNGEKLFGRISDICSMPGDTGYAVTDSIYHRVMIIDPNGEPVLSFGRLGRNYYEFNEPSGIVVKTVAREVYDWKKSRRPESVPRTTSRKRLFFISDRFNNRVCAYTLDGNYLYSFGTRGVENGQLYLPSAILSGREDEIYVCDGGNDRIEVLDTKGKFLRRIGRMGTEQGQFHSPTDIAVDANKNFYVADATNGRIQKFDPEGRYKCSINGLRSSFLSKPYAPGFLYRMPGNFDSNEINFSMGELKRPVKINIDNATGRLFILDAEQARIFVLDSDNFRKGRELYKKRQYREAIKYLTIAVLQTPSNINALFYLGYSNYALERFEEAYGHFKKLIADAPASEVAKYADYFIKKIEAMRGEIPPEKFQPLPTPPEWRDTLEVIIARQNLVIKRLAEEEEKQRLMMEAELADGTREAELSPEGDDGAPEKTGIESRNGRPHGRSGRKNGSGSANKGAEKENRPSENTPESGAGH